jgi:hypothetical protein
MKTGRLAPIVLPDFGLPTSEPQVPSAVYEKRIADAQARARKSGLDVLIVYGDREHFANLAYLTGYDPRFEEALLILTSANKPALLIGNEGWGYAELCAVELKRVLYQSFSLLAQPRDRSAQLAQIFRDEGIGAGQRIGVVGWKYFDERESSHPRLWMETPAYIIDTLRDLVGDKSLVLNAADLFMNPSDGLRTINDVDQLAVFEFRATLASQALRNVIFGLKPGMTEYQAVELMKLNGVPWSAHLMLSSGPRAHYGLVSPSMREIARGEPFTMALGLWGGLSCRAGFVVHDASELPEGIKDYVEKLVAPYFGAIAAWYEYVGIGVKGRELYDIIHQQLADPFFGIQLNPGHLIHLDEWVHSPINADSDIELRSGMAIQVDVIPATGTPYFTTNIEDGIALADQDLRAEFERKYPEAWHRIERRRQFMKDALGIQLKPEVLPFSNIQAYLPPYLLNSGQAMCIV